MFRLFIERPEPETVFTPGGRISGFGWLGTEQPVSGVAVLLNETAVCRATVGLSRADVLRIYGRCPDGEGVGFIFTGTVPDVPPGPARLTVVARAAQGERVESIAVAVAGRGGPSPPAAALRSAPEAPPPMRALLEEAGVDDDGLLRVSGWAVSLSDLTSVQVRIGEVALGEAQRGISRKDVASAYPVYPNGETSGFLFQTRLRDVPSGRHTVSIAIAAVGNMRRELTAEVVVPELAGASEASGLLHFYCDEIALSSAGRLTVSGWAAHPAGISAIEAEVADGASCLAEIGRPRPDVGNAHPELPGAHNAGFRAEAELGTACDGEAVVVFTIRDGNGRSHTALQPVAVHVAEAPPPAAPAPAQVERLKYFLDVPAIRDGRATEPVRGFMSLAGWAFGRDGIAGIEVFIDGQSHGFVYHGIRREDLQETFPGWDALLSGFAMMIPPQAMKKGTHDVRLVIRDKSGYEEEIAFKVDAEPAAEGPGPWQLRRKLTQAEADQKRAFLAGASFQPSWRVLIPLARADSTELQALAITLRSLGDQAYEGWRAEIVAASRDRAIACEAALGPALAHVRDRITVATRRGPAAIVPRAERASATLIACLLPGDVLGADALLEMSLGAAHGGDFLYCDERRTDPSDGAVRAFFKPDWSPDLLLSTNYIGRFWAATQDVVRRAGLTFGDVATRDCYALVLRLTEHAGRIAHVPHVLCESVDPPADPADTSALDAALARRGIDARVEPGCIPGTFDVRHRVAASGLVSIVIPTIASRGLIRTTIESIRARTTWPHYEIVCLDNIPVSDDPERNFWKTWIRENADRVVELDATFNWSRFNNAGARAAAGAFLLFLNDDIEVLAEDWLDGLIEHAQRPEIGIVGPQLLYPDGRVQHAGMFLSDRVARHAFRFAPRDEPGHFGLALTVRNVISVTGACMMMRRDVFDRLGGFDEEHAIINNDVDFCLRARRDGLRVVYTPHVSLVHHEMVSRSALRDVYNSGHFDVAWRDLFHLGDPYLNPHLTTDADDYVPDSEPVRVFQTGHPLIARANVRRILAVKVDHIGDFITALPAFRRLKAAFPSAELHVLVASASVTLAALEPAIDVVHEFNFFHARSEAGRRDDSERELAELAERLAPHRFDIALDLRRQPDTREILRHTGAKWLAGFDRDYRMMWLDVTVEWDGDFARSWKRKHASEALLELADAVVAATDPDRSMMQAPMTRADARLAWAGIAAAAPVAERMFARTLVAVHTGAGALNKQWPAASFAGLIDLLIGQDGANVVLIGGPDESVFAGEVASAVRNDERLFSLVGQTSLRDLPAVLRACDLYVGNDSGPKHMAAALGVPTIGIHSGSVDAGEWGAMGPHTATIRRDMTCAPCYLAHASDCHRGLACLYGIKVGDVYRACRNMLLLARGLQNESTPPTTADAFHAAAED